MSRLRIIVLSLAVSSSLPAALTLTISETGSNGVQLEIDGDGTVSGSSSPAELTHFLVFGTVNDSFLTDGELGNNDLGISSVIQLGSFSATEHIYRDDNGNLGLDSYFEFDFPTGGLPTNSLDLNSLDGIYVLDAWQFSDFKVGSYTLVNPTLPLPVIFSGPGLDSVTLNVIPEPSTSALVIVALALFSRSRTHRLCQRPPKAFLPKTIT